MIVNSRAHALELWTAAGAAALPGLVQLPPPGRRSLPKVEGFTKVLRDWVGRPARWDRVLEL